MSNEEPITGKRELEANFLIAVSPLPTICPQCVTLLDSTQQELYVRRHAQVDL
jgi:hypothetical protein